MIKKIRWGIVGGACAILVFYLTIGFVVAWMILDKIAAQTSHSASPFANWWQVLIFVCDIVFALGIAASYTMMFIVRKKKKAEASAAAATDSTVNEVDEYEEKND